MLKVRFQPKLNKSLFKEFGKACSEICFYTATLSDYTANYDEIGDLKNWLLDSGATSHFTPTFEDLLDPFLLDPPLYIRVADGSRLKATYEGAVEIRFKSDQGTYINLRLLRVLYVKGLQTRLFSSIRCTYSVFSRKIQDLLPKISQG